MKIDIVTRTSVTRLVELEVVKQLGEIRKEIDNLNERIELLREEMIINGNSNIH